MTPVVAELRARTLAESLALRVHAGYQSRRGWMAHRACATLTDETALPTTCPACPVRLDCLADTMRAEQQHPADYIVEFVAISHHDRRRHRLPRVRPIEHGTTTGYYDHLRRRHMPCGSCKDAYARHIEHTRPSRAGQRRKESAA